MRIEIDTKNDTKEELAHLAKMLLALSGSSTSHVFVDGQKGEEQPSQGLFNLFNDDQPAAPQQEQNYDTFSLFESATQATEQKEAEQKKDIVDDLRIVPYG